MTQDLIAARRQDLENKIEELIALLDLIDGDPDLEDNGDAEPSIGSTPIVIGNEIAHDLEWAQADEHGIADRDALDLFQREGGFSSLNDIGWHFDGDGHRIGRKLLSDHVKDRRKLTKALERTRVSIGHGSTR